MGTGCQKLFEINDEHKVRPFYEKRMGQDVDASCLGDEWKGYTLRITGGNDKQGFPMKQGVLTNGRVQYFFFFFFFFFYTYLYLIILEIFYVNVFFCIGDP